MSRAPGRLDEEARFELAMAAGAQEKRNQPVMLVVASAAVLLAALMFAAFVLSSRNEALSSRAQALADERAVAQMELEWRELERRERDMPGQGLGEKMPLLLTRMEELAREAGLKDKPVSPQTKVDRPPGIVVTEYTYRDVKDRSLTALLEWLRSASSIPGMEVMDLRLKPDATNWTMNVTFRRWERAG